MTQVFSYWWQEGPRVTLFPAECPSTSGTATCYLLLDLEGGGARGYHIEAPPSDARRPLEKPGKEKVERVELSKVRWQRSTTFVRGSDQDLDVCF